MRTSNSRHSDRDVIITTVARAYMVMAVPNITLFDTVFSVSLLRNTYIVIINNTVNMPGPEHHKAVRLMHVQVDKPYHRETSGRRSTLARTIRMHSSIMSGWNNNIYAVLTLSIGDVMEIQRT
jgi:hypothetical protein